MKYLIFLLGIVTSSVYATDLVQHSPVGYWKTIDDVTGQPKAIVQIWEKQDKSLAGRIVKIFPLPHEEKDPLCKACKGERHNKRIIGMVFLEKLKKNKTINQWADGRILDPKSGKTYHSMVTLINNGQKLNVRGYFGLPLFGRTQTWIKLNGSND